MHTSSTCRRVVGLGLVLLLVVVGGCSRTSNHDSPDNESENATDVETPVAAQDARDDERSGAMPEDDEEWYSIFGVDREESSRSLDFIAIQNAPGLKARRFDPVAMVQSVNYFVSVGKEQCAAALEDYARLCRESTHEERSRLDLDEGRVFALGLALFAPASGLSDIANITREDVIQFPPHMWAVGSRWAGMKDADFDKWPRFPYSMKSGIPFLLAPGYRFGSVSSDALAWILHYVPDRRFEDSYLRPSSTPKKVADELMSRVSEHWMFGGLADSATLDHFELELDSQVSACIPDEGRAAGADSADELVWSDRLQNFVAGKDE